MHLSQLSLENLKKFRKRFIEQNRLKIGSLSLVEHIGYYNLVTLSGIRGHSGPLQYFHFFSNFCRNNVHSLTYLLT